MAHVLTVANHILFCIGILIPSVQMGFNIKEVIDPRDFTTQPSFDGERPVFFAEFMRMVSREVARQFTYVLFEYCHEIDMCGLTVQSDETTSGLCCFQCDCHPDCHLTNACCPHVPLPMRPAASECHSPNLFTDNLLDYRAGNDYLFVRACPPGANLKQKQLCENRDTDVKFNLFDVIPVTSSVNTHYANIHCAHCNNADELHLWEPEFRCFQEEVPHADSVEVVKENENSALVEDMLEKVKRRTDCYVGMVQPDDIEMNITKCHANVISECNQTGKWAVYDRNVEEACHNVNIQYLFKPTDTLERYYQNILCAVCNGEPISGSETCPVEPPEAFVPFKKVLKYKVSIEPETSRACRSGEIPNMSLYIGLYVNCLIHAQQIVYIGFGWTVDSF